MNRKPLVLILGGTALFCAAVAVAVFWFLGNAETAARHASTQFAAAVVKDDPRAAPAGGADYVAGVRGYFGPVTSATVIGAHNKSINTGDAADTRSYFVADVLLRTEHGPAVLELEFDNHSLSNATEKVSAVHELAPAKVPGGTLASADRAALEAAFAARGDRPADAATLQTAPLRLKRIEAPAVRPAATPERLRCVQDAHGDVGKLARCTA